MRKKVNARPAYRNPGVPLPSQDIPLTEASWATLRLVSRADRRHAVAKEAICMPRGGRVGRWESFGGNWNAKLN